MHHPHSSSAFFPISLGVLDQYYRAAVLGKFLGREASSRIVVAQDRRIKGINSLQRKLSHMSLYSSEMHRYFWNGYIIWSEDIILRGGVCGHCKIDILEYLSFYEGQLPSSLFLAGVLSKLTFMKGLQAAFKNALVAIAIATPASTIRLWQLGCLMSDRASCSTKSATCGFLGFVASHCPEACRKNKLSVHLWELVVIQELGDRVVSFEILLGELGIGPNDVTQFR